MSLCSSGAGAKKYVTIITPSAFLSSSTRPSRSSRPNDSNLWEKEAVYGEIYGILNVDFFDP